MTNWIIRSIDGWRTAERHRREYEQLADLPDRLLYDIGLTRDGVPSLARQLRSRRHR
jgi:uncharacterized protein YjiS (DUF1127 family)